MRFLIRSDGQDRVLKIIRPEQHVAADIRDLDDKQGRIAVGVVLDAIRYCLGAEPRIRSDQLTEFLYFDGMKYFESTLDLMIQ